MQNNFNSKNEIHHPISLAISDKKSVSVYF